MKHHYLILFYSLFLVSWLGSQTDITSQYHSPKVSLIGEDSKQYEELVNHCGVSLLTASDGNMESAYLHWIKFIRSIELYAVEQEWDINGLKVWMNVFWDEEGNIQNMYYYPKPNCRNIVFEEFSHFLNDFAAESKISLKHDTCFSHYASVSFPTFAELYLDGN